jgi:hypothetical protein
MQDGCKHFKPTWIPTWHQMDHVSRSLGLFIKTVSMEVDLTQNQETMALRNLTTVNPLYSIMCEEPASIEIH